MSQPADDAINLLHGQLDALREALEQEDGLLAEQILHSHDRQLRQYVEQAGPAASLDSLRSLLALQHSLSRDMLTRRDQASARLRAQRQSRQAASAYQHAREL